MQRVGKDAGIILLMVAWGLVGLLASSFHVSGAALEQQLCCYYRAANLPKHSSHGHFNTSTLSIRFLNMCLYECEQDLQNCWAVLEGEEDFSERLKSNNLCLSNRCSLGKCC